MQLASRRLDASVLDADIISLKDFGEKEGKKTKLARCLERYALLR